LRKIVKCFFSHKSIPPARKKDAETVFRAPHKCQMLI